MYVAYVLAVACSSPPSKRLYAHPWPDERSRRADGSLDLASFPIGTGAPLRRASLDALVDASGFGRTSAVFFPFDRALDQGSLPRIEDSTSSEASVFIIDVDRASSHFGERSVIDVRFLADGGPFGGTNLLAVLPFPGIPLRPSTRYAVIVTSDVRASDGTRLASEAQIPADSREQAWMDALDAVGVARDRVVAHAFIRTGDPVRALHDAFAQALSEDPITIASDARLTDVFDAYCVFETTVEMPVYQGGRPPYTTGGGWVMDEAGALVRQREETARVWLTVPRQPAARYPSAIFVRAGGGGDRPLVDRGPRDREGRSVPGEGPARELARAGYVGVSVDGPLGGLRNRARWDEETVLFNVQNPIALRDNIRQSALELALLSRGLERLDLDASACDGASPRVILEPSSVLIAHSNGATIAPLAAAIEPRFHALTMSGAGASWIRQIIHKQSPVALRPLAELLVGYGLTIDLTEHDPILSLLQWAGEAADPLAYADELTDRHVLVFQGVRDTYIPPPIANPVALGLALDLGGDPLDEDLPYRSAWDDLALIGRGPVSLPRGPDAGGRLRIVTQVEEDGIENGHEALFQQPSARRQLFCFLLTLAAGSPTLVSPDADDRAICAGP